MHCLWSKAYATYPKRIKIGPNHPETEPFCSEEEYRLNGTFNGEK
jgi:hypothetical protein